MKCSRCGKNKRPEEFHKSKTFARGYSMYCKQCVHDYRDNDEFRAQAARRAREYRAKKVAQEAGG